MSNIYESELVYKLMERDGLNIPSSVPPYEAEIKAYLIEQVKLAYPKLNDYEAEWLLYNYTQHLPAEFPIETITNVNNATVDNVVPYAYKSAILKGNTKYRDIDTGDILDTFDETKNLELVSVKMPVLTTSNGDGTKTNILTVNEEVTLHGIGDVKDELNLLTGELTQRVVEVVWDGSDDEQWTYNAKYDVFICESLMYSNNYLATIIVRKIKWNGYDRFTLKASEYGFTSQQDGIEYLKNNPITIQYQLTTESIKTVDLSVVDENGNKINHFIPIEGTMHIQTDGEPVKPSVTMGIPVEATTQNLASFIEMEV